MISVYDKKEDCCGCTACQHICPTKSIEMKSDEEGFLYPKINQELCIDCGLCKKACAFQNGYDTAQNFNIPYVYAVKHADEKVRMTSTSGGVFTAIADYVLDKDGVVYGVAFDEDMNVVHKKASTKNGVEKFKGSKYVQSNLGSTFAEIKKLLVNKKFVLFTGTPCQTAGLRAYLTRVNTEKLFLCDIICHGVPSPLMWRENLNFIKEKHNEKLVSYQFRDKIVGWRGANVTANFANKRVTNSSMIKTYVNMYFLHTITRKSCHNCKYTNLQRPSDITIADFWGIENNMPDFDDNMGTSLVLINSSKGQYLYENIKDNLIYRESNTKDCMQPQLQYPSKASVQREQFWEDYQLNGYNYIIKKYAGYSIKGRVNTHIVSVLKKTGLLKKIRMVSKIVNKVNSK